MKKLFILFAVAIGFVACNEDAGEDFDFTFANEVVETYTMEQMDALIAGFNPKTIDRDQLILDLTEGAIYNTSSFYTINWADRGWSEWVTHPQVNTVGGDLTFWSLLDMVFNSDGTCLRRFSGAAGAPPKLWIEVVEWGWEYNSETNEIIVPCPNDGLRIHGTPCEDQVLKIKVLYYKSPLLICEHQMFNTPFYPIKGRHKVNLRAYSHDDVKAILEEDRVKETLK